MNGSIVIGISFGRMETARKKISKALDAAQDESDNLSRAASSLEVDDGRLRQKAETLSAMRVRINSRMMELWSVNEHIDYAVQRFQETDELCAKSMKTGSYEVRKSLGLVKEGGIFGEILGGLESVVNKGREAWKRLKSNSTAALDSIQAGLAMSAAAGKLVYNVKNPSVLTDKGRDIYNLEKKIGKEGIENVASKVEMTKAKKTEKQKDNKVVVGAGNLSTNSLDIMSVTGNFLLGVTDAAVGTIKGIWHVITHPIEAAEGLAFLYNASKPGTQESAIMNLIIVQAVMQASDDFSEGDANKRARMIGRIVGEVLLAVVGTKGTTAAIDAVKASCKSGTMASWLSKIGKGTAAVDDLALGLETVAEAINFEKTIVNETLEHGQFIKNGTKIGNTIVGTESSIDISACKSIAKDAVFTHNHPTNGILSWQDLETMVDFDMAEIRAVTPNGRTYSITRGTEGWKVTSDEVKGIYEGVQNELRNDPLAIQLYNQGKMDDLNKMLFDKISERLGGIYNFFKE